MRRYPENEKEPIKFVGLKKIIVETEDDKNELLEAFRYLHDFMVEDKNGNLQSLDSDYVAVNLLMHMYQGGEMIEVLENGKSTHPDIAVKFSEKERIAMDEFKKQVKNLYGEYGTFTYKITPTGIRESVVVYSHLAKIEREITDMSL